MPERMSEINGGIIQRLSCPLPNQGCLRKMYVREREREREGRRKETPQQSRR
jgi:hypothetical protein